MTLVAGESVGFRDVIFQLANLPRKQTGHQRPVSEREVAEEEAAGAVLG